ncbi:MAG: aminoacyl-tRNA hydrolase [Rhodospirillaceae bacterium]|jgi:peptidyl-tRNA hydrolase, PTH1 family|nr:aminoacyl-tRNA hydrolase [Rhodospirillaceae bacterium]MBT4218590.1 aminoacyl-tRNA hydrolase [Rhodospirillaceae bacterium]MBT4464502.1 aminoacyl-tRNA hydrolase [Rhodospirillaceae bacterium]MBT5012877.1 aminoacyl-tRNA hydrolase [Rhodospirillaceae bacterium]MBT5308143.1 aminoacyl-tRNA hydrolase [Rhodospirillaceae bacterium]
MLLLVGLGNPGGDYANNRHNIGFMAVDEIVRRHSFTPFKSKFSGELSEGRIGNDKVLALKPMTYMNESGRSVGAAASFYKIEPADVLVIHDEIDLEAGRMRCKSGGGHAGHNGLRSIHAHIGDAYRRLRLGVGHPGDRGQVSDHVLKDFSKADKTWLEPLLDGIADHIGLLVDGDDAGFSNRVALDLNSKDNH